MTQTDIQHNNKHRAATKPIWNHIKENFNIKEFLQIDTPLERIKRVAYTYDYYKFKDECIALIRKAHLNSILISQDELEDCLNTYVDSLKISHKEGYKKDYKNFEIINKKGTKEKFRLLKNGDIIKPVNIISVKEMSDFQLLNCLDEFAIKKEDFQKHIVAYDELVRRGLKKPLPF